MRPENPYKSEETRAGDEDSEEEEEDTGNDGGKVLYQSAYLIDQENIFVDIESDVDTDLESILSCGDTDDENWSGHQEQTGFETPSFSEPPIPLTCLCTQEDIEEFIVMFPGKGIVAGNFYSSH